MTPSKTVATNKRARYDYEIIETVEAGLVLTGTEIKALRAGRLSLGEAYAKPDGGEIWLVNAHVAQYAAGTSKDHDPTRPKKLLLHKDQIRHLSRQVMEKGLTLVPLKLYITKHLAKVELALARGRRQHDKRRAIIERYREGEAREAVGQR